AGRVGASSEVGAGHVPVSLIFDNSVTKPRAVAGGNGTDTYTRTTTASDSSTSTLIADSETGDTDRTTDASGSTTVSETGSTPAASTPYRGRPGRPRRPSRRSGTGRTARPLPRS